MVNHYQEKAVEIHSTSIDDGNSFSGNITTSETSNKDGNIVTKEYYKEFDHPDALRKNLYNIYNRVYISDDVDDSENKYKRNKSLLERLNRDFMITKERSEGMREGEEMRESEESEERRERREIEERRERRESEERRERREKIEKREDTPYPIEVFKQPLIKYPIMLSKSSSKTNTRKKSSVLKKGKKHSSKKRKKLSKKKKHSSKMNSTKKKKKKK